jgi:hypothetical protein
MTTVRPVVLLSVIDCYPFGRFPMALRLLLPNLDARPLLALIRPQLHRGVSM